MLRAVKGSNPTPGEYYAFSGGHTWSIVGEHFDNTTFCIPLVPAYIQLALVCTRVVAVILYMTTNYMNTSRMMTSLAYLASLQLQLRCLLVVVSGTLSVTNRIMLEPA